MCCRITFCHSILDCNASVKAAIPRSLGLMNKVESAYLSYSGSSWVVRAVNKDRFSKPSQLPRHLWYDVVNMAK